MTGDRGAAGIALVVVAGLLLALASALAMVVALWSARATASAAADAAALAAAPVTFRPFGAGGTPAGEAARYAAANGARLVACRCPIDRSWARRVVTVRVARAVRLPGVGTVEVAATASAEFRPAALAQDRAAP